VLKFEEKRYKDDFCAFNRLILPLKMSKPPASRWEGEEDVGVCV